MKLRRGWKDDGRDDWAKADVMQPLEGELVIEYDHGIPRLKIGDGIRDFKDLPYISIDSFILPTPASVTLYKDKWQEDADHRFYQRVTVENATITPNSKVDLQPSAEQLTIFHEKDLAFVAENENGVVTVYCVGLVPTHDYRIQATVTEVVVCE
jgi:hypothetical protein